MLDEKTGYLEVSEFDTVTADQFKAGLDQLTSQGMERLVLDLRNNPGGELNAAVAMIDYLLPDGETIVSIADKNGEGETYSSEDGHQMDLPVAILVNGNSASASEVFTGAMKDHDRAWWLALLRLERELSSPCTLCRMEAALSYHEHYYHPDEDIHGAGIEPDVSVELKEGLETMIEIPKDQDNQLQAAVEALNQK